MLATQNRTKVVPNKLVLKHEEFIVNKSLASKVRQAKSTINAENKHFEKIIVTRQKRDFQNHSSQSKSRTTLEHPSLENPLNNPYDIRTPHSKEFRVKTTDNPSGKLLREFIMSPVQKLRSETSGGPPSGRGTLGYMFTSPRNTLDKPPLQKNSLPGASYKSAILDRLPSNQEKSYKEIQRTGSLKEQLIEKEMELKYLKDELKDWWHEDFKNGKMVQFKEISIDYDPQSAGLMRTSPERSVEYSVKGAKSTTGKLSSLNHRHNSDSKVKKDSQIDLAKQRDLHLKSVQYTESLRILEKLQEKDMSKKKLEPLRKDKENTKEAERRPASEAARKADDLRMRFSNNFENRGILKLNKRYQSQGVDVINEASDYEKEEPSKLQNEIEEEIFESNRNEIEEDIIEGKSHDSFEEKKPQKISFKVKNINQRYQTHDSDHEDEDHTRSESPQIVTTSKTLMLQSRVYNSRTLNKFNFTHANQDDDDENSF